MPNDNFIDGRYNVNIKTYNYNVYLINIASLYSDRKSFLICPAPLSQLGRGVGGEGWKANHLNWLYIAFLCNFW
jgi:hypothetical protein